MSRLKPGQIEGAHGQHSDSEDSQPVAATPATPATQSQGLVLHLTESQAPPATSPLQPPKAPENKEPTARPTGGWVCRHCKVNIIETSNLLQFHCPGCGTVIIEVDPSLYSRKRHRVEESLAGGGGGGGST